MARRLQDIEIDKPVAEPLTEVASLAEGAEDCVFHETGSDGTLRAQTRKVKQVPMPETTDNLRLRHQLVENSSLKAKLKRGNQPWLSDVVPGTFTNTLSKYILGEKVMLREAARDMGIIVPWSVILKYEHEIRRTASKLVREEGFKLDRAIRHAIKDPETGQLYLLD